MRVTLAVLGAAVLVVLSVWVIDDVVLGDDIPRGVRVDATPIGGLSRADAAERLDQLALLDTEITFVWEGASVSGSAGDFGLRLDIDTTLDDAADRGGLLRPVKWIGSLVSHRDVALRLLVRRESLTSHLVSAGDEVFVADRNGPSVALVEGVFVSADQARVPVVDPDELERLLLAAVTGDGPTEIALPILGTEEIDVGGAALAAEANELTEHGIDVSLIGDVNIYDIPESVVREWVRFGNDGAITLDAGSVVSTLENLFIGMGQPGDEATFVIDYIGGVHIIGGAPGSVCCTDDTAQRLLAGLRDGTRVVDVRPKENPDAKGVAWAESLGITEVVGEFTTNFKPGQSRVANIARISELTRGAIIEPGETFSINDYVGRRTTENGFIGAGMIANGVFITSVGGGISQYATTLFNAAFFAGLDFGAYQSHSIYISRYPYGREATVSFPNPDLQIINNTPYGILLWPTTTADSITVRLYSTLWVVGEQTGQRERAEGVACTRVTTERTRTWVEDGHTEIDTVTARYRPEGVACDGSSSTPTTTPTTTEPPTT